MKETRDDEGEWDSESMVIPCLDFTMDGLGLEEGSGGWKDMSKKVREACESHGCFLLTYDKIPRVLREEMFMVMKALFDLPEETKMKHTSPKPYRSYKYDPIIPLCQSFGIDDAPFGGVVQAFTNLMWPQGNPTYCEAVKFTSSKMLELSFLILKMIQEAYNVPERYTSDIEDMKSANNFRLMKYKVPENNKDSDIGLLPHTDKCALAILCQNEVQGLEVRTKSGKWIQLKVPQESFVVFVGDILKAWSNGRLHAATHKVMMSGDKERYSFGLFALPNEDMKIEVPSELVDDEMHPLHYRPFNYGEFVSYFVSTLGENALEAFAGV